MDPPTRRRYPPASRLACLPRAAPPTRSPATGQAQHPYRAGTRARSRVKLALFDRDGGGEDLLIEGRYSRPPVGPDGVDRAVHGGDALVVAVLVVQLSAA